MKTLAGRCKNTAQREDKDFCRNGTHKWGTKASCGFAEGIGAVDENVMGGNKGPLRGRISNFRCVCFIKNHLLQTFRKMCFANKQREETDFQEGGEEREREGGG